MFARISRKLRRTFLIARVYLRSDDAWYVTAFWRHFYQRKKRTHDNTFWLGVNAVKPPTDLWVYQEIVYEKKPDIIIETGSKFGGTTFFLASICELMGHGKLISIDIEDKNPRPHPRITYLVGSSISDEIVAQVKSLIPQGAKVMVILDSNHHFEFVNDEIERYYPFVTSGNYLIVEDSCVGGNPVYEDYGPGPIESIQKFLASHPEFRSDRSREKYWVTYSPKGFLLRN